MFGVFDGYEQQLLRDWIEADALVPPTALATNRFRRRPASGHAPAAAAVLQGGATVEQVIAHYASTVSGPGRCPEVEALFEQLAEVDSKAQALAALGALLSPANHPTPAGLAATRLYADLFNR